MNPLYSSSGNLWRRWVAANVIGEVVGLGAVAASGLLLVLAYRQGAEPPALLIAAVMIAAGTFEGVVVGLLQSRAVAPYLPELSRLHWIGATAAGAATAWMLGMLPSTLMADAAGPEVSTQMPGALLIYLLAAAMGLVLGAVLSFFQWRILRHHVRGAGWWIPANSLAWSLGMPVIFFGMEWITAEQLLWVNVLIVLLILAFSGAVVGAVHGVVLVRLISGSRFENRMPSDELPAH